MAHALRRPDLWTMRYTFPKHAVPVLFSFLLCAPLIAQQHMAGQAQQTRPPLPDWVQLMYQPGADPGAVQAAFKAYYAAHPFEKNTHTQYYKRWQREIGHDLFPKLPAQQATYAQDVNTYLDATRTLAADRSANWSCIGPIDWDHTAVDRSYACGAAHVYTVEQAATDPNLIYAGTANAGVWKSTNKGISWTNMTKDMMVGTVLSLEIDHTNANNVYFGASGALYKTIEWWHDLEHHRRPGLSRPVPLHSRSGTSPYRPPEALRLQQPRPVSKR